MGFSEDLHRLEVDLGEIPKSSVPLFKKAVQVTSILGKKAWQKDARGKSLGAYPASIDFEMKNVSAFGAGEIQSEIGPNLSRGVGTPGLGITEDTPGGVRGRPRRAYRAAESAIEADLPNGLKKAADDALRRAGL